MALKDIAAAIAESRVGQTTAFAAKELTKDFTKPFRPGNLKEDIVNKVFEGQDIFARVGRKAFGSDGKKDKEDKKKVEKVTAELSEVQSVLQKVLVNTAVLPDMAKDVSVIAQNMQQLVELNKPDADDFFRQEDAEEAALEAGDTSPTVVKTEGADTGGEKKKGLLGKFLDMAKMFGGAIKQAFKKIFSFKNIMKVFSKVFVPLTIIASLFSGIKDGFEEYRKTGDLSKAIFAGLGGVLEFLTLGVFGEDTVRNIFDKLGSLFEPISQSIQKVFGGIKSFFLGLFGGKDVKADDTVGTKKDILDPPAGIDEETPITDEDLKKRQKDVEEIVTPEETTTITKTVSVSKDSPMTEAEKAFAEDPDAEFNAQVAARRASGKTRRPGKTPTVYKDPTIDPEEKARLLKEKGLDPLGNPISPKPVNKGTENFRRAIANAKKSGRYDEVMSEDDGYDEYNLDADKDSRAQTIEEIKADEPGISDEDAKAEREEQIKDLERQKKLMEDMKKLERGESLESVRSSRVTPVSQKPSSPNGNSISEKSSNIAEAQRMEGSADMGDVNNTNNTNVKNDSSSSSRSYGTPDVVDQQMLSYQ